MNTYIRQYQYIQDYYRTLYEYYGKNYQAYPITYYLTDWENSIYEKDKLVGATYEKMGIGNLSGMKWKKITLFPVYSIDQISPVFRSNEEGVTLKESMNTQISFSSLYFNPTPEFDAIHMHQDFMFDRDTNIDPIFFVSNIEKSTYGNIMHWKCTLKVAPYKKSDIEQQISSHWMYIEPHKKIYPSDLAIILLKLQNKINAITNEIENNFHNSGFYLRKV